MKAGALVLYELCWALLFTVGIVRESVLDGDFLAGLMVGMSFGFSALTVRERDVWPSWFQSFATTFSGASFLSGQWWLASNGKGWQPVFISFGPGFLFMGLYSFIKHRLAART